MKKLMSFCGITNGRGVKGTPGPVSHDFSTFPSLLISQGCASAIVNEISLFLKNQEKLMKELKQLQQEDLARRRQTVAQMPPQLVALPYKRSEMKEDWQRELEFAFEDMYNADRSKIFSVNFPWCL